MSAVQEVTCITCDELHAAIDAATRLPYDHPNRYHKVRQAWAALENHQIEFHVWHVAVPKEKERA